jgi:PST family polysaccharide transporter
MLVGLGNMFVLTWWIGPHAYGTFVTAVGLTTFFASLTRFGVDTYLVRCETPPDSKQYNVAFTLVGANSVALLLVGLAIIPLLRHWYAESEFVAPYVVLLLSVPLTGMAGLPTAKLERELKFGMLAGIELGAQFGAFLVALALAWRGFGLWAPVMGLFAWQSIALVGACGAARFSPRLQFDFDHARTMLVFGFGFSASVRMWQLRTLINPLLVGRFAGPEGVAFVAFALRVVEALGFVRTAAGRLAIAALARLQHEREQFRQVLERAQLVQVITLGPLLCGFALCGPWVVPRLLGPRWLPSLQVYPLIAAGVLVNSIFNLQASALFVIGRHWAVMWGYTTHVVLLGAATFALLPQMGIAGYGWAEIVACAGYIFIGLALSNAVPLSYRKLLPWVVVFLVLLGVLSVRGRWIWCLVPIGAVTILGLQTADRFFGRSPAGALGRRVLTLLLKVRWRGWEYVRGLSEYKVRTSVYRLRTGMATILCFVRRKLEVGPGSLPRRLNLTPLEGSGGTAEDSLCPRHLSVNGCHKLKTFHFTPLDIPRIVAAVPELLKDKVVEEADRVMQLRFCFRGRERVLADPTNWSESLEDTSWAWDLNRHAWFLRLGTAYYYTGRERYLQKLAEEWERWIEMNPPGRGFNWRYPFEVGARLQNWMWAYFLVSHADGGGDACAVGARRRLTPFQPRIRKKFLKGIREHAEYLDAHLEHHWPNNHLLLESKALCEFGMLFPLMDESGRFLRRGRALLEREVMRQVLPDGGHSELCSMYHRVVAGELGELVLLARRQGQPFSHEVEERVASMAAFSQAMQRNDGSWALLGDSAAEDTCLRFDFVRPEYSDLNYWVAQADLQSLDLPGRGMVSSTHQHSPLRLDILPEAGYAFIKGHDAKRELHLTFDFGAFSRNPSPNHGHCDALSFELYAGGRPLIVDPGAYLPWKDGGRWARHFRSTAAHNTLRIDGQEQSDLSEYSDVKRTALARLIAHGVTGSQAKVSGECVPHWCESIKHRREVCVSKELVTIRDFVLGEGKHLLEWTFQFAPEVEVLVEDESVLLGRVESVPGLRLRTSARVAPRVTIGRGEAESLWGWVARSSAAAEPAYAARYSLNVELPFEIKFVIDLAPAGSA